MVKATVIQSLLVNIDTKLMFYVRLLRLTLILNNADGLHLLCYFYTHTEDCRRWFSAKEYDRYWLDHHQKIFTLGFIVVIDHKH